MITDKDREEANIIIRQAYSEFSSTLSERLGIDGLETIIAGRISYIRYKAAEEIDRLKMVVNKYAIAVKALEEISVLSGRTGRHIDDYGEIARNALKEVLE